MSKIEVNKVAEILKKQPAISPAVLRQVIEEMNLATQPDGPEGDTPPPVKKQWVILISDPEGRLPKFDFVGWILQIPENESVATTQDRIFRSCYDYNVTKKGMLMPVKTVGEGLENVPAKFFKEADVWVKTKVPVLMLKTDNSIPKEDRSSGDLKEERPISIEVAARRFVDGVESSLGEGGSMTISSGDRTTTIAGKS